MYETNHLGELCNPAEYKNVTVSYDSNNGQFVIASRDGYDILCTLHGVDLEVTPNVMTVSGWSAYRPSKQINTSTYLLKKAVIHFEYFGDIDMRE